MPRLILCFDCGDTLVAETTQVFADNGDVLTADPIPGAVEALQTLHARGYRMALVADGRARSFRNTLGRLGLWELFETYATSETVGAEKPSPRMFKVAAAGLDLSPADFPRMVMFGNNRRRDIRGANRLGMTTVLLDWNDRYPREPELPEDEPDFLTHSPCEWPALVALLEEQIASC